MNQEDKMRKRNIQADIYAVISDGKVWTIKEIAEEVESTLQYSLSTYT